MRRKEERGTEGDCLTIGGDVLVSGGGCQFSVEVGGGSFDNALEYEWMVRVTLSGKKYEFGYSKWRLPELPGLAREQSAEGSFSMLLNSGQKSVWLDRKNVSGPFAVGAYPAGDGVAIYLTDPNLLDEFMAQRPAKVTFVTDGTMMKRTERRVQVTYTSEPNDNSRPK